MYSATDLTREIEQAIEQFENASERRLHPEWITQSVMERHTAIDGDDCDFYRLTARGEVRNQVRLRLNRFKARPEMEADKQIVFEGFERLQKRYLVCEDGEQVAIRVQDMSSAQRRAKSTELRAMGAGCYQHADELDRYDAELMQSA